MYVILKQRKPCSEPQGTSRFFIQVVGSRAELKMFVLLVSVFHFYFLAAHRFGLVCVPRRTNDLPSVKATTLELMEVNSQENYQNQDI